MHLQFAIVMCSFRATAGLFDNYSRLSFILAPRIQSPPRISCPKPTFPVVQHRCDVLIVQCAVCAVLITPSYMYALLHTYLVHEYDLLSSPSLTTWLECYNRP